MISTLRVFGNYEKRKLIKLNRHSKLQISFFFSDKKKFPLNGKIVVEQIIFIGIIQCRLTQISHICEKNDITQKLILFRRDKKSFLYTLFLRINAT